MRIFYLKKYLLLSAFIFIPYLLFAQSGSISGKVFDENKQPLPGATVSVIGGTQGAATEATGDFRIKGLKAGKYTLEVKFIGYATMQNIVAVVAGNVVVNFNLKPDSKGLNEVVVIGYGTTRKKDLTGSITTVSSKDFQTGNITTPEQLIAGKVAGVSIQSNGGAPGAGSTIRIRGGASLNASNDPLIVLDGVQLSNDGIAGAPNALSLINPNDIETFTVLKDASATAIYGSRASNGVILITTKKGTTGKPVVNFSTQVSVSTIPKEVSVLSADQIRAYVKANGSAAFIAALGNANTDWQKQIYQTAISNDNNLSISGTAKKVPYRVSVGYMDQTGILKTGSLDRTSATINLTPRLFDNHLKIDINLRGSLTKTRFANESAIGAAVTFDPTQPVYSGSKRYGGYFEFLSTDPTSVTGLVPFAPLNPVGLLEQNINKGTAERSIGNAQFDYKFHFLPDLHVNANLGYDVSKGYGTSFTTDSAAAAYKRSPVDANGKRHGGVNNPYNTTVQNTTMEFYLNYTKDIKALNSRIDATAGYAFYDYVTNTTNYPDKTVDGTVISVPTYPYDEPEHTLLSYYGRLNYTFDGKYLLTGTIRKDGSSRFGANHKYGYFPSVAGAWRIHDEDFLKDSKILSDLKLRVGYGVTGQQDGIGNYSYVTSYSLGNQQAQYQLGSTFYSLYRPSGSDPDIKWEQSATTNVGIDYGFLNNRITGAVDVYYKNTTDLLNAVNLSAGQGFTNIQTKNVGDMVNRGIEFSIIGQAIRSKNISWDISLNATYNENKITKLTDFDGIAPSIGNTTGGIAGGTGNTVQINSVGYSRNTFYVYQQVYGADGKPIDGVFVDRNGDGIINEKDLYRYKSPDPKYILGLSSSFSYKKINVGITMRANIGNYAYNNVFSNTGTSQTLLNTTTKLVNNVSTNFLESGLSGTSDRTRLSDYYVSNASFVKMDNANVGYNFGSIIHKKANLAVSFNVQNVFTITKYKGLDPEVTNNGIDNNFYPRPRTFVLGLNLNF
jgi:TonB-linked SusC/RagA family outer membrane protein